MMIMRVNIMHKAQHDLMAIMSPASSTHHKLRTIRGIKIQLIQNQSE